MRAEKTRSTFLLPRALSRERAAAYLDISPGTFDSLVESGKLPKPRKFVVSEGRRPMMRWDRVELDSAFEELDTWE